MVSSFKIPLILLISSFLLRAALAEVVCEDLPSDICAFAISSSGKRCLIETEATRDGGVEYQCRTSEVAVVGMENYVESDACVEACGVDRKSVGISSDSLLEPGFTAKLCSTECLNQCPNIVDLYVNLAAGEGVFLPDVCAARRANPHRSMFEIQSSGAAPGPFPSESSDDLTATPASAPAPAPAHTF